MILIIGLGNPGEKYAHTRHNAGFLALDEIQKSWNFPEFKLENKFDAYVSKSPSPIGRGWREAPGEGARTESEIILVKPITFMNNSGVAVQKIMSFYKLSPADIIVIHDDLDLEIGNYKISTDSSAAGHNGVQNVIDKLGTQNFKRVRIGVETAGGRQNRIISGEDFVLQNFTEEEIEKISAIEKNILEEIQKLL